MVHISLSSSVKVEASLWIEPLADHFVIDEHQRRVIFLDECVASFLKFIGGVCINSGKGCERSYLVIVVNLITINQ